MTEENKKNEEIIDSSLMQLLDRGIDDMESGNELPLKEAMSRVDEIRNRRRTARGVSHTAASSLS